MTTPVSVKVGRKRHGGLGLYGYNAEVAYADGTTFRATFISTVYADTPWVTVSTGAMEAFIDKGVRERCGGRLTPSFIRTFYKG